MPVYFAELMSWLKPRPTKKDCRSLLWTPLAPLDVGAEANQAEDRDAHEEVDGESPILIGAVMAQGVRKMGDERELID